MSHAGAALTAAAVDCRRAGIIRPIGTGVLRALAPLYPTAPVELDDATVRAGLDWAIDTSDAPSGLLRRQVGGFTSFDYLLDRMQVDERASPVPAEVWHLVLDTVRPDEAWHAGMAAYWSGRLEIAERAFRISLDTGDHTVARRAALGLSEVASLLDQFNEAQQWLRVAASAVDDTAVPRHSGDLQQRDDLIASERWYRQSAGVDRHADAAGQLVIDHEHAAMEYIDGRYVQDTRRRLVNRTGRPVDRYPIRIAVDRFPDDADRSREHYRQHPLRIADLGLWAECDGRPMTWEVRQDLPHFKEIWLLFEDAAGTFPLAPGAGAELRYGYAVGDQLWGPWSQRPVRVPTRRLSVQFAFPEHLTPRLHGSIAAPGPGASLPIVVPAPLTGSAMNDLVARFCALGVGLPAEQDALRADPAAFADREWQLEQDMLTVIRDVLDPSVVLAEEYFRRFGAAVAGDAGSRVRVVLDPLDGSGSFMRGESTYACTLAVWVDDRLTFGLVHQPAEQRVYWAVRGQPPHLGDQPLRPAEDTAPRIVSIRSTVGQDPFVTDARERLAQRGYAFEHVESSSLKLCWIAERRRAGLVKRLAAGGGMLLEWGVAAGMLISHGAGIRSTGWDGREWTRAAGGLLVGDHRFIADVTGPSAPASADGPR